MRSAERTANGNPSSPKASVFAKGYAGQDAGQDGGQAAQQRDPFGYAQGDNIAAARRGLRVNGNVPMRNAHAHLLPARAGVVVAFNEAAYDDTHRYGLTASFTVGGAGFDLVSSRPYSLTICWTASVHAWARLRDETTCLAYLAHILYSLACWRRA
jgi:hypothetical protein